MTATLLKIKFKPGMVADATDLESETRWLAQGAKNTRFDNGQPETMGGWEKVFTIAFTGIARGGHGWVTLSGERVFAWGTESKLYAYIGGEVRDITPLHSEGVLTNPFSTTSGSPTVGVTLASHHLKAGDVITFSNQHATVGGLTLNGAQTVVTVTGTNTFTITASGNASSTVAAGGGNVDYTAALPTGLVDGLGGSAGYGSGTYGSGTYGSGTSSDTLLRVWSLDNFGEDLLANPRGGGIYRWQPETAYNELITGGDMASGTPFGLGTGWSVGAGVATAAAGTGSNLSQDITAWQEAGRVYRVTFTVTRTAGSLSFKINAGSAVSVGDASAAISLAGTYTRIFRMPASATDALLVKDSSFAGTIDDWEISLEDKAFRVDEAPHRVDAMFVDPFGIVHALGTEDILGVYSPLLERWSDRSDVHDWVPLTSNYARDFYYSKGGRLIGGLSSRQQNIIFTDEAVYASFFSGNTSLPFTHRHLGSGAGLIGMNAVAEVNGLVLWWGTSGQFHVTDGALLKVLDCPLRRFANDSLSDYQEEKIYAGINPSHGEVIWFYPRDNGDGNKECSDWVSFQYAEPRPENERWSAGTDLARTTWITPGALLYPVAFSPDGYAYNHEKGQNADGNALESYIISGRWDIKDGDRLTNLMGCLPDIERLAGSVNMMFYPYSFPQASVRGAGVGGTISPSTTKLDFRLSAREVAVEISASSSPSFWRLGTTSIRAQQSGARR